MAALTGRGGQVLYKGKTVLRLNNWSLNVDSNQVEVTSWTSSTGVMWREYLPGLNGWSGSVSGFWDGSTASTAQRDMQTNILTPTTGQIILHMDESGGANFRGNTYLTRLGVSAAIDGSVDASYDFQGTGALTYSTAT